MRRLASPAEEEESWRATHRLSVEREREEEEGERERENQGEAVNVFLLTILNPLPSVSLRSPPTPAHRVEETGDLSIYLTI